VGTLNLISMKQSFIHSSSSFRRMQLERSDRHGKTEVSRLLAENSSLRQRNDRADADLLHSRRENLRLVDQISNLEKEVSAQCAEKFKFFMTVISVIILF
jgi:serologically defined colon cancer antigen 8